MKSEFIVTTDGTDVAGQRSPGIGKSIFLTEKQAEHPLRLRHIARPSAMVPASEAVAAPVLDAEPAVGKPKK